MLALGVKLRLGGTASGKAEEKKCEIWYERVSDLSSDLSLELTLCYDKSEGLVFVNDCRDCGILKSFSVDDVADAVVDVSPLGVPHVNYPLRRYFLHPPDTDDPPTATVPGSCL